MHETMPGPLFDAKLVARRLQQVCADDLTVHDLLSARLSERLVEIKRPFQTVTDVSFDGGAMARRLRELYPQAALTVATAFARLAGDDAQVFDDEQAWPLPAGTMDLVTSHLRLPLVNDVPYFLHQARQLLKPDGLVLASTLGLESFRELRLAFAEAGLDERGHVIPLTDVREVGGLLQRLKFALPVVDRDVITLTFPDFGTLLARLTSHGARQVAQGRAAGLRTPRQLQKVAECYQTLFPRSDGRLPLTLEVIYLHAWKPDESQPRPLKPGSGKVPLVRILASD